MKLKMMKDYNGGDDGDENDIVAIVDNEEMKVLNVMVKMKMVVRKMKKMKMLKIMVKLKMIKMLKMIVKMKIIKMMQ